MNKRMIGETEWTSISIPQSVFDRFNKVYRNFLDFNIKIKKYELIDLMCQMMEILLDLSSKTGESPSSIFETSILLYAKSIGYEMKKDDIWGEKDESIKTY